MEFLYLAVAFAAPYAALRRSLVLSGYVVPGRLRSTTLDGLAPVVAYIFGSVLYGSVYRVELLAALVLGVALAHLIELARVCIHWSNVRLAESTSRSLWNRRLGDAKSRSIYSDLDETAKPEESTPRSVLSNILRG